VVEKRDALKFEPIHEFPVCFYFTDAQCQNIGGAGLCTSTGGCVEKFGSCESGCCFITNSP
jgi:hypothetical protein